MSDLPPATTDTSDVGQPVSIAHERQALRTKYKDLDLTATVTMKFVRVPPGAGGFADIYQGSRNDRPSEMILAFKCIRETTMGQADKPRVMRRLEQEISVWSRLQHPNIQPLYGLYWEEDVDFPALVSEWHENGNLINYLDHLNQDNAARRETKLALLRGVLDGIEFLHSAGIIHAGISGANVLVSSNETPLLCGFSGAWTPVEDSVSFTTERRSAQGTVAYMAPELVATGDEPYSQAIDMWAFGCLMVEVVTGHSAWGDQPGNRIISALANKEMFRRPDSIDNEDWSLVHLCCALEPSDRCTAALLQPRLRSLH